MAADNGIVIAASYWGKFKTVSQMFMIIVLIADLGGVFDIVGTVLIWLSLILTVVSLIDYIAKNVQVLTQGRYVMIVRELEKTGKKIRSGYYLERFLHGCG